ncbi:MAG: hypothetical protein RBR02_10135 [Desulfuromonadaceae bacterium]|nr:hypothetical protein [Desulfuromonadaceae bacterium]
MTLETTLILLLGLMTMFFIFMRYKTDITIFNLLAIGCIVSLGYQYLSFVPVLIVFIGAIIWLVYDTFAGGY